MPLAIHGSRHWIVSEPPLCWSTPRTCLADTGRLTEVKNMKEATSWEEHCVADQENWVPFPLLLGGRMTPPEPPSASLCAFLQRVSGKNKDSHVHQQVRPECFLALGGPALSLTRFSLCLSPLPPFPPSSEVAVIVQVSRYHPFSPPTLPTAFYSSTRGRKDLVPLQGTPDFPSFFHQNESQRPSCTSLLSWPEISHPWGLWSTCKHWQNQWDFHTVGWGTRCRCYW